MAQFILELEPIMKDIQRIQAIAEAVQGDVKVMQSIVEPVFTPNNVSSSKVIRNLQTQFEGTVIPAATKVTRDVNASAEELTTHLRKVKETMGVD